MSLLLVSILCILAICRAETTDIFEQDVPQIINGRNAQPGEFPYQVSLQVGPNSSDTVHFCGGSIINSKWVLTAAHCIGFESKVPSNFILLVRAGITNLKDREESEQVSLYEKSFMNDKFVNNDIPQPNDMGLVKVKTPFTFNSKVQPIALPAPLEEFEGLATVSGWGKTADGPSSKTTPTQLQTAELPIIDRKTCQNMTDTPVDETNICCDPETYGKTFCQGDSGGHLVVSTEKGRLLIGAVSWGSEHCGKPPSVFARVSYFIRWIDTKMATE